MGVVVGVGGAVQRPRPGGLYTVWVCVMGGELFREALCVVVGVVDYVVDHVVSVVDHVVDHEV